MVVLERPAGMTAVLLPPRSPGPDTSFSLILVVLETSAGLPSSSTACTTTSNLPTLNGPRQARVLVRDQDNLEGNRIVTVLPVPFGHVSLWHQQESRYLRSLIPPANRAALSTARNVEIVIVWASLDSLSPGEEEGFALEQRAQEITEPAPPLVDFSASVAARFDRR